MIEKNQIIGGRRIHREVRHLLSLLIVDIDHRHMSVVRWAITIDLLITKFSGELFRSCFRTTTIVTVFLLLSVIDLSNGHSWRGRWSRGWRRPILNLIRRMIVASNLQRWNRRFLIGMMRMIIEGLEITSFQIRIRVEHRLSEKMNQRVTRVRQLMSMIVTGDGELKFLSSNGMNQVKEDFHFS